MSFTELNTMIGKQVITKDGYILGDVLDIRYINPDWDIKGLKIKTRKTVSDILNIGSGKSLLLLETGEYVVNDVVLLPFDIDSARSSLSPDNISYPSLGYIQGKKVFSSNGLLLGTVDAVHLDVLGWHVVSIDIRVDKMACEQIGIKKGLFAKKVSGILTAHIASVTDGIALNIDTETVKSLISVI